MHASPYMKAIYGSFPLREDARRDARRPPKMADSRVDRKSGETPESMPGARVLWGWGGLVRDYRPTPKPRQSYPKPPPNRSQVPTDPPRKRKTVVAVTHQPNAHGPPESTPRGFLSSLSLQPSTCRFRSRMPLEPPFWPQMPGFPAGSFRLAQFPSRGVRKNTGVSFLMSFHLGQLLQGVHPTAFPAVAGPTAWTDVRGHVQSSLAQGEYVVDCLCWRAADPAFPAKHGESPQDLLWQDGSSSLGTEVRCSRRLNSHPHFSVFSPATTVSA